MIRTPLKDSFSFLPTLTGKDQKARPFTIHHSIKGSFAIRQGKWKLCLCPGSGGWSAPRPGKASQNLPPIQLYDLENDPAEKTNLQDKHPEVVKTMVVALSIAIKEGRTTAGAVQKNDTPVPDFKPILTSQFPDLKR